MMESPKTNQSASCSKVVRSLSPRTTPCAKIIWSLLLPPMPRSVAVPWRQSQDSLLPFSDSRLAHNWVWGEMQLRQFHLTCEKRERVNRERNKWAVEARRHVGTKARRHEGKSNPPFVPPCLCAFVPFRSAY